MTGIRSDTIYGNCSKRTIMVLDNVEHILSAASIVGEIVAACPELVVLVTSRSRLRVTGELEFRLEPLPVPEPDIPLDGLAANSAAALLADRVQSVQPAFAISSDDREAVIGTCRALEGLPLAIELAASKMKILTLPMLLERLQRPLDLLQRGNVDLPHRQQTLRNTIAWSFELLDDQAKRLFRYLSVFPGGFTVETCEVVLGGVPGGAPDALMTLETLVDSSLVYRAGGSSSPRFSMLESIREFGREELVARKERVAADKALVDWCKHLTREEYGFPTCVVPKFWLARLDEERVNIRAAHRALAIGDNPVALLEFVAALGHYLYLRGPHVEALQWFEAAMLHHDAATADIRLQGYYWSTHLALHLGQVNAAQELANEAVSLANEIGDPEWRAATTHCLALVEQRLGHFNTAERLAMEQISLWDQAGIAGLSGFGYHMLGDIALERGEYEQARQMQLRAIDRYYDIGGFGWVALATSNLGKISASKGDRTDAARLYRESLAMAIEHHAEFIMTIPILGLASIASDCGLHEIAVCLASSALHVLEEREENIPVSARQTNDRIVSTAMAALDADRVQPLIAQGKNLKQADWLTHAAILFESLDEQLHQRDRSPKHPAAAAVS
ncbi:hypothetical protein BH24CHL4_BH24CHL4_13700 [soil metagenome]